MNKLSNIAFTLRLPSLSSTETSQLGAEEHNQSDMGSTAINNSSDINIPERKQNSEATPAAGGLNNLIRRMTGFKERTEQQGNEVTPNTIEEEKQRLVSEREDESKLEIPAFLRRQAN